MLKAFHILNYYDQVEILENYFIHVYFHGLIKGKSPNKKRKSRSKKKGKNEINTQGEKPKCLKCKKRHIGECLFGKRVCFRCKDPGHIATDCPSKVELEKEGKGQGFASTQKEVKQESDVMMVCLQFKYTFSLFYDFRATHYYICQFMC